MSKLNIHITKHPSKSHLVITLKKSQLWETNW